MKYSESELKKMYEQLVTARIWADKWERGVFDGAVIGSAHLPHGEEAVGIGVINAMRDVDYLAPTHRFQPALIHRYGVAAFTNEVYNKVTGFRKGMCYDFHLSDIDNNILFAQGTLGSMYPVHTGFAWALKAQKKDGVVVIVQGDGALAEGNCYEAWQMAALHEVPALYIVQNNDWAEGSRTNEMHKDTDIGKRAIPIGLDAVVVDGNDVVAVREAVEAGIEKAARFEPNVIEFKTLRWKGHFCGDLSDDLVDPEEIKKAKEENCPIKRIEERLLNDGIIDNDYIVSLKAKVDADLTVIFKQAAEDRFATKEEVINYDWLYASPETGGEL